jgi:hypothetical protein
VARPRVGGPPGGGALDDAGVQVEDIAIHQPSLDDVFMRLTGNAGQASVAA